MKNEADSEDIRKKDVRLNTSKLNDCGKPYHSKNNNLKVSIDETQLQLEDAQRSSKFAMGSLLVIITVLAVILLAFLFLVFKILLDQNWEVVKFKYITTFSTLVVCIFLIFLNHFFKLLKAQLHINKQNDHRMMIIKCMTAFYKMASTPKQKNDVLIKTMDLVTEFRNTGLITKEEDNFDIKSLMGRIPIN